MDYNTKSEQFALLATVVADPEASVPEVKHAMLKMTEPKSYRREVVVEGRLFSSVIEAARWLHYGSPDYWTKAQRNKVQDISQIIRNLQGLVQNRCKAHTTGMGVMWHDWFYADTYTLKQNGVGFTAATGNRNVYVIDCRNNG